jgi:dTDP-4-amino-4,6-dideoxygalactose transaminase
LFATPLVVGRPNVGDRERLRARLDEVFDSRRLSNDGPYLKQFEARVAVDLGVRHAVAVSNATIGLQLAARATGMTTPRLRGEAPEVIVPAFTFSATAHALAWEGVRPVFVDVDPVSHCIDAEDVERLITPRTTGIVGVHLWGNLCDDDAIAAVARRHGLAVLYDAAHAYACSSRGVGVANVGDAAVFSFHATKFVCSAEGGVVTTDNDLLAAKLRRLRSFGLDGDLSVEVGTNAKMDELSAALGLTSLEHAEEFIVRNRENFSAYAHELDGVPGVRLVEPVDPQGSNWQYVVVEVDPGIAGRSRDAFLDALATQNVLAKRYFWPGCHRLAPYRASFERQGNPLPHTERLCERLLQLPTGTGVTADDAARIGEYLARLATPMRRVA